ncbi:hypothetical protein CVT24_007894 [Panaeolus cyanescens]|uniref:Uncharacterized protein n=1 Tax=Panaeolus cyanescens TaxID=181874 RepID=A0A409X781_9AGAR|nr:hypothetical protein CVT24_007894 [Panaeolus cyanescens]
MSSDNNTRPIRYIVKVLSTDMAGNRAGDFEFTEPIPAYLVCPSPPEAQTKATLAALSMKYHDEIMRKRIWKCWNCEKNAVSMVHNPMCYLHQLNDPSVVDLSLGICEDRGRCEVEGRRFFKEKMEAMQRAFPRYDHSSCNPTITTMSSNVTTRPINYIVKVLSTDMTGNYVPDITYTEVIPANIICPSPPEYESKVILAALSMKHHDEIMRQKSWRCWNCEKRATSMLHNPMGYLHKVDEPEVLDMVLGICSGGRCEAEGRRYFAVQMSMAQQMYGNR